MGKLLSFLSLTEIKTKVTSVMVFALTSAYFLMRGWPVSPLPTALFFISVFLMDLAVSALNHYTDSRLDGSVLPMSRSRARTVIIGLLVLAVAAGLVLVALRGLFLLFMGGLTLLAGLAYSGGPYPLSRTPLGEILSGLAYGLVIPLGFFYINLDPDLFLSWQKAGPSLSMTLHLPNGLALLLLASAPVSSTAAIMLANNLCDLEADRLLGRRTLPYWLGVKKSLRLFSLLALAPFLSLIMMVLLGQAPLLLLLILPLFFPALSLVRSFWAKQDKQESFPLSLKLYLLNIGGLTGAFLAASALKLAPTVS